MHFRGAQHQAPALAHAPVDRLQDDLARRHIEVDQNVPAENEVERSQVTRHLTQIHRLKLSHPADVVVQRPFQALMLEVLQQHRRRQTTIHFHLLGMEII